MLTPIVSASSDDSAAPHDGQKRAVSGESLPQREQVTVESYRRRHQANGSRNVDIRLSLA
jgi:hypothetical protein